MEAIATEPLAVEASPGMQLKVLATISPKAASTSSMTSQTKTENIILHLWFRVASRTSPMDLPLLRSEMNRAE